MSVSAQNHPRVNVDMGECPIRLKVPYWWRSCMGERHVWVNVLYVWTAILVSVLYVWTAIQVNVTYGWAFVWVNVPYGWSSVWVNVSIGGCPVWLSVLYGWTSVAVNVLHGGTFVWVNVPYGLTSNMDKSPIDTHKKEVYISGQDMGRNIWDVSTSRPIFTAQDSVFPHRPLSRHGNIFY